MFYVIAAKLNNRKTVSQRFVSIAYSLCETCGLYIRLSRSREFRRTTIGFLLLCKTGAFEITSDLKMLVKRSLGLGILTQLSTAALLPRQRESQVP